MCDIVFIAHIHNTCSIGEHADHTYESPEASRPVHSPPDSSYFFIGTFQKLKTNAHLLKRFVFTFALFFGEIGVDAKFKEEINMLKNTCKLVYQLCAFELSEDQVLRIENLLVNTTSKLAGKSKCDRKPRHHMAMHWTTAIRRHGVLSAHWVFPHESRNANIKAEFANVSGHEMGATIFRRLTIAFILSNSVTPSG